MRKHLHLREYAFSEWKTVKSDKIRQKWVVLASVQLFLDKWNLSFPLYRIYTSEFLWNIFLAHAHPQSRRFFFFFEIQPIPFNLHTCPALSSESSSIFILNVFTSQPTFITSVWWNHRVYGDRSIKNILGSYFHVNTFIYIVECFVVVVVALYCFSQQFDDLFATNCTNLRNIMRSLIRFCVTYKSYNKNNNNINV